MRKSCRKRALSLILLPGVALAMIFTGFPAATVNAAPTSNLTLTSSSQYLAEAFNWAKAMALSKVQTGIGNNIPSYQCALQERPVFCMRDWAHQVDGAHLLGLSDENYSMLEAFANLQTPGRKWYSIWEVNYDGSISPIDYHSDTEFWRNLAGMFELVEKGYRQYEWTANSNLINDSTLSNFYSRTMNDFISLHDGNGNGIAEEHSSNGWVGVCSYNEGPDYTLTEAADGLGCQYKASRAYSKILAEKGDISGSNAWNTKAINLKNTFNSNWYSSSAGRYIRGFTESSYSPVTDFGYESSWFIPFKELCDAGPRADNYLDFIYNSFNANPSPNIEAWTYLPDVYYTWNQNDRAWYYLKHLADSRSDYPEVSYTIISAIATGMMGVQPNAPDDMVTTLPRLPSGNPSEVAMLEMNNIPIGSHSIKIKHEGNVKSTLRHNSGLSSLAWEAQFPGSYSSLIVNGVSQAAGTKNINGATVSYVTVNVAVGQSVVVETGATPPAQKTDSNLVLNPGFESGNANWTFTGGSGTATNYPHTGSRLAYLDSGTANKVSQNITINNTGTYNLSGWIAAGATAGVFGIKVNGSTRASVNIPANTSYNQKLITGISLNAGDNVEVYVTGANSSWVNIDDISLSDVFNGTYKIINRNSGKALNVPNGSTSNETQLIQWPYGGGNNEKWVITPNSDGTYKITNVNSNKAVVVQYGSKSNNAAIIQYPYSGTANEKWMIVSCGGGYYRFINQNSGKCMTVQNGSTANSAPIIQYTYNGGNNDMWQILAP